MVLFLSVSGTGGLSSEVVSNIGIKMEMYTQFLRVAEHLNGLLQFQDSKFLFGDIEQVELKIPI